MGEASLWIDLLPQLDEYHCALTKKYKSVQLYHVKLPLICE